MKAFITGASGFIGEAVVKEFLSHGHQVLGLARTEQSAEKLQKLGAKVQRGTLDDLDILRQCIASSDGVIHLGFKHDELATDFLRVWEDDRKVVTAIGEALEHSGKPFINASGTLIVSHAAKATEVDMPDMSNPQFSHRAQSDKLVLSFAEKGVRAQVLRLAPTNHGEGDRGFINMIAAKAREIGYAPYIADGSNHWPAVHRLDTARLYRLAFESGKAGSVYHSVAEEAIQTKEIAEAIGQKFGVPAVSKTKEEVIDLLGFVGHALAADNIVSSEETRKELKWVPTQRGLIADIEAGAYTGESKYSKF
ncbi:unnamed protein product [Clonostachys rhizophaga]|uniref:NAD-dependent epimerase/dehydratase domain-containing protein n=1 Tax=Clonostachys rhizophaga TaxID=160324 RepID=A0A9N9VS43_9HYPO|nr:unnamed protein product [Clonostachys rhizophaga]